MTETTPQHLSAAHATERSRAVGVTADFAGLMSLYGCNYRLLDGLCAEFDLEPGSGHITARGDYLLALSVECATRYTTTIDLVYSFLSASKTAPLTPVLHFRIRVYHDTRQAEVIQPNLAMAADTRRPRHTEWLGVKWRFNYFLSNVLSCFSRTDTT